VQAQEKQHVVSLEDLGKDTAKPAETREANEAAVRELFSSAAAQEALKSANVNYVKIDQAVSQLSDEDVAKLAQRSRQVESNFAAGNMSDRDLLVLVIIGVLIIALVAALR